MQFHQVPVRTTECSSTLVAFIYPGYNTPLLRLNYTGISSRVWLPLNLNDTLSYEDDICF